METSRDHPIQKMGTIKDKNGRDLVDAEEIKKRWKEYMEELYKKILMNRITIMVWLVTQSQTFWSAKSNGPLRSTAACKASGCNEIPAELYKSLKKDAIKVLHSLWQQIWKTQQWPQYWKSSILIPISKKGSTNHQTITLISHASKDVLKILHARLQHYPNPDVHAGFRKGRGTRDQIANIHWIIEKAREFQ